MIFLASKYFLLRSFYVAKTYPQNMFPIPKNIYISKLGKHTSTCFNIGYGKEQAVKITIWNVQCQWISFW